MIAHEIVSTCSNPDVARAAVASIGGDFAGWFKDEAARRNVTSGQLAATVVREFGRSAHDVEWRSLGEAIRGSDMPILSGLQFILERQGPEKGRAR
jgi:hypothetical protein